MNDIRFGRLEDLPLREAWKHEAHQFTPWLAENIDHLSDAIGIPLELTGTEVAVESFSADILARNPKDDSIVLIENQLEITDHTHLGQIMTYLAGLEAQTVVWIAPAFREPHLSAIRWLNEHTADGFSFFAVKARVVRIGDSPFAPIFEVVEKPNDWERTIDGKRREAIRSGNSAIGDQRKAFWDAYLTANPQTVVPSGRGSYVSMPTALPQIKIVLWIGQREGGIFLRGRSGMSPEDFLEDTAPMVPALEDRLGLSDNQSNGKRFGQTRTSSVADPATWPAIQTWMEDELRRYLAAIETLAVDQQ